MTSSAPASHRVPLSAPLILASASPRRRRLLERIGVSCDVRPVDVDEAVIEGETPEQYVLRVARLKLEAALARVEDDPSKPFVLSGDTSVIVDGVVLGKPTSAKQSGELIRTLSARSHQVHSAVALGREGRVLGVRSAQTEVVFRRVTAEEIDRYVATGEGMDKAGGYALQGLAGAFVERIEGAYGTVVGLPLLETLELLRAHGVVGAWP
ncbi:MAG: Maf family protein [Myxococcota bacterium]